MAQGRRKSKKHSTRGKPRSFPRGTFEANGRGFGFVKTSAGEFFVPESKTRDAMDGDVVEVAPLHVSDRKKAPGSKASTPGKRGMGPRPRGGKREEARVVRVVERARSELIGRYEVAEPFGIVVPDDPRVKHDVFTLREKSPDVPDGALVRVRILEYPTRKSAATGEVVEVFDEASGNDIAIERIIARHNLDTHFSDAALSEADSAVLDVRGALEAGYRDIRDRFTFTIDPTDAKDFDDALSIEQTGPDEWRLGVHIADVSAYVGWASPIDMDARRRATSTYLADRVIPMLPPRLSENLCSLRPGEERLCMTADLVVDARANLLDCDFYPAVMRSDARLTYDQAQMMLDDADPVASVDPLASRLARLSALAKERQRNREAGGGIEFRTKEAKVMLGADGKPTGILVREKTDATGLVEEAMIFANEAVAAFLEEREAPCAYRDHEPPSADALAALIPTLQEFKWFTTEMADSLPSGNPHVIQHVLDECAGRAEDEMVTMLLLRAMMRAVYAPSNEGHYGLGLRAYCHFTSPIRRYPDLVVHRMLKWALGFGQPDMAGQRKALKWLCEHSSEMERNAEAASYDSQKAKMVEYMAPHLGEEFDAIVSGVVSYGLYVRLENCVEGLVPVRSLGDEYFAYNEARHSLRGVESNDVYRLGQRVRVKLVEANTDLSQLDFHLM